MDMSRLTGAAVQALQERDDTGTAATSVDPGDRTPRPHGWRPPSRRRSVTCGVSILAGAHAVSLMS